MPEPSKHPTTPALPIYQRLCHLGRGQPAPAASVQYQEVNPDHPAVLNADPDQLDNIPLGKEEEEMDRRRWHMDLDPKHQKHDRSEVLVSAIK